MQASAAVNLATAKQKLEQCTARLKSLRKAISGSPEEYNIQKMRDCLETIKRFELGAQIRLVEDYKFDKRQIRGLAKYLTYTNLVEQYRFDVDLKPLVESMDLAIQSCDSLFQCVEKLDEDTLNLIKPVTYRVLEILPYRVEPTLEYKSIESDVSAVLGENKLAGKIVVTKGTSFEVDIPHETFSYASPIAQLFLRKFSAEHMTAPQSLSHITILSGRDGVTKEQLKAAEGRLNDIIGATVNFRINTSTAGKLVYPQSETRYDELMFIHLEPYASEDSILLNQLLSCLGQGEKDFNYHITIAVTNRPATAIVPSEFTIPEILQKLDAFKRAGVDSQLEEQVTLTLGK